MCPRCILWILTLISLQSWAFDASADPSESRLLFVGDILLSRNVHRELDLRGTSPWAELSPLFLQADLVVGNLEGAVGESSDCLPSERNAPCFSIPGRFMSLLPAAGFKALSVENNHGNDLGAKKRADTIHALKEHGLIPLTYEASPTFFRFHDVTIGMITLNLVPGRNGDRRSIPSIELRRQLRSAGSLSNLVVVYVHWGNELLDWPNTSQREAAQWLIRHGADLIVGHHPHVVQPPETIDGKTVFFSLGNHLFDQKYPATKEGLIADCRITQGLLRCGAMGTRSSDKSFFPKAFEDTRHEMRPVQLRSATRVSGIEIRPVVGGLDEEGKMRLEGSRDGRRLWQSRANSLADLTAARLDGRNEFLFTLEWHYSPIDGEMGLRPYVYQVTEKGLIARWRGSALAWPLLDAMILPEDETVLCGLHRGDSFIDPQPDSKATRIAAYRWNGFGFSGISDPETTTKCRRCFDAVDERESRP